MGVVWDGKHRVMDDNQMKFTEAEIDTLLNNLKVAQWNLFSCQTQRNRLKMTDQEREAIRTAIVCMKEDDAFYPGESEPFVQALENLMARHTEVSVAEVE